MSGACSGTVQARLQLTRGARDGAAELWARSDSLQLCGTPSRRLLRTLARVRATFAEPLAHLIRRRVDGREHDQRWALMHAAHQSHQPVEGGLVQTLSWRFLVKEKPPAKGFFYWKSECILKRKC